MSWTWQEARWVAAIVMALLAAVLAWRKTPGWGWFLFIAFVCMTVQG